MDAVIRLDLSREEHLTLWHGYLRRLSDANGADDPRWRPLFRELYGIRDQSFAVLRDGKVRGAALLYRIRSPFFGDMLVSSPYVGCGGSTPTTRRPCAASWAAWRTRPEPWAWNRSSFA